MANPKNRELVEEELKQELERDRTKTYVVEISPLGLVEMTRQNVTDGPREILTKRCPTCAGDGIVVSEASSARRRRAAAARTRRAEPAHEGVQGRAEPARRVGADRPGRRAARRRSSASRSACSCSRARTARRSTTSPSWTRARVERLAPAVSLLGGPGDRRQARRGRAARPGCRRSASSTATTSCVGDAPRLVGKKVKVRVERVLDGTVYATLVDAARRRPRPAPITAEGLAEKPTRAPRTGAETAAAPAPADGRGAERADGNRGSGGGAEEDASRQRSTSEEPARQRRASARAAGRGAADGAASRRGCRERLRERRRRGGRRRRRPTEPGPAAGCRTRPPGTGRRGVVGNGAQPARRRRSRSRRRPAGTTGTADTGAVAEEETAPQAEMPEATAAGADEGEAPKRRRAAAARAGAAAARRARPPPQKRPPILATLAARARRPRLHAMTYAIISLGGKQYRVQKGSGCSWTARAG